MKRVKRTYVKIWQGYNQVSTVCHLPKFDTRLINFLEYDATCKNGHVYNQFVQYERCKNKISKL